MNMVSRTLTGLWESLSALAINRLELFGLELREEQDRFIRLMILALFSLLMLVLGLILLTAMALLLTPVAYRPWLCLGLGVLFLLLAILSWWRMRTMLCSASAPFPATRNELRKDSGLS